tara:strand:- start:1577 stop:3148 length:1572 start_codon:yes stop_codon:yes gene_type:complete
LSDQKQFQQIKSITLDYLEKIGATIEESDGLYEIEIPSKFESIFGSNKKRITFESEIANTHSCELVIFGSNFLATIIDQIKKQAPVVSGNLKKLDNFDNKILNKINVYDGKINLVNSIDDIKTIFRFYFNVDLKNIQNKSTLQWIDIDSETKKKVEFPKDLNLESVVNKISFDKKSINACYDQAIKNLQEDIAPIIEQHTIPIIDDMNDDLESLKESYSKRIKEINDDIKNHKSKLHEWDNKINHAKKYSTRNNYQKQKTKAQKRIAEIEQESTILIDRIKHDKNIQQEQITKRYTTKVNSTLIASIVFSYSLTRCTLEIKNEVSESQTTGEYRGYSKEFVILCTTCNVPSKEIHLCVNGHVGCNLCSEQCITCNKDFCDKCNYQLNSCYICKEKNCNVCSSQCTYCSELSCLKHEINCAICEKKYCSNHTQQCKTCEQVYSVDCIDKNKCNTCNVLTGIDSKDSKILDLISINSDFNKYKKWEYSTNSKFSIFRVKKMIGKKIIVLDNIQRKIIVNKKEGWL